MRVRGMVWALAGWTSMGVGLLGDQPSLGCAPLGLATRLDVRARS
jgi:hypothetical protein